MPGLWKKEREAQGTETHARGGGFGFGVMVLLGAILVLGGLVGLAYAGFATLTTMLLFGWLLLIGGVVGVVQAIQARGENAFWLVVAVAALNIAAGVIIIRKPEAGAEALTLFVALLLLTAGLFRVVGGVASMSAKMIWTILVGVVDLVLGLLVLAEWPSSSVYAIGTFVSLALLIDGLSMVSLGLTGRRIVGLVRDTEVAPLAASAAASEARAVEETRAEGRPVDTTEWTADKAPERTEDLKKRTDQA
jgi:uncharacterized membrane protein HdeD (DUF308 family)